MTSPDNSRTTHDGNDGVVVFNIGMTVRKPHRPDLWVPVARAMVRMLTELRRAREAADRGEGEDPGFLAAETLVGPHGPWVVQYWRDAESLHAYARAAELEHLPAWRTFNTMARRHPDAVGIWHETYQVPAEGIETFYRGARLGLGAARGVVPVGRRGETAVQRMGSRLD